VTGRFDVGMEEVRPTPARLSIMGGRATLVRRKEGGRRWTITVQIHLLVRCRSERKGEGAGRDYYEGMIGSKQQAPVSRDEREQLSISGERGG
jgi:hypothetical protein